MRRDERRGQRAGGGQALIEQPPKLLRYRRSGGLEGSSQSSGNIVERYRPSAAASIGTNAPFSRWNQRTSSGSSAHARDIRERRPVHNRPVSAPSQRTESPGRFPRRAPERHGRIHAQSRFGHHTPAKSGGEGPATIPPSFGAQPRKTVTIEQVHHERLLLTYVQSIGRACSRSNSSMSSRLASPNGFR